MVRRDTSTLPASISTEQHGDTDTSTHPHLTTITLPTHYTTTGLQLIGALHPGLNWHVRTDQKYTAPTSLDELRQHNREYIHKKLQQQRVDPHWRLMADEIAKEVQQGRMAGPFHGPQWLHHPTTPLLEFEHTSTLQPLPHTDPIIAMAFSIEQTGSDGKAKIRRGEDWRRSGHNQACQMTDQPYHHTPDHYTWLAQYTCRSSQEVPLVWGHDHDGAYRQLPLDDPSIAYVLLLTPSGPTLWHHHVLLFGSAASVWAYTTVSEICYQPSLARSRASQWFITSTTTAPSNLPGQPNPGSPPLNDSILFSAST